MVARRVVKEEDRVPCAIYKQPRRMLLKVGSGGSGDPDSRVSVRVRVGVRVRTQAAIEAELLGEIAHERAD